MLRLGWLEFLDRVGHEDLGRAAPPDRERTGQQEHPEQDDESNSGPPIDLRPRLGRGGGGCRLVFQTAQLRRQAQTLRLARVQLHLEFLAGTLGPPELATQTEDAGVEPRLLRE